MLSIREATGRTQLPQSIELKFETDLIAVHASATTYCSARSNSSGDAS